MIPYPPPLPVHGPDLLSVLFRPFSSFALVICLPTTTFVLVVLFHRSFRDRSRRLCWLLLRDCCPVGESWSLTVSGDVIGALVRLLRGLGSDTLVSVVKVQRWEEIPSRRTVALVTSVRSGWFPSFGGGDPAGAFLGILSLPVLTLARVGASWYS